MPAQRRRKPTGLLRRGLFKAGAFAAVATGTARVAEAAADDKPFADHHLVLQLSDREAGKQALVLNVANNMLEEYGPDRIAIEVVTFGPGIEMLREGTANRARVDSLVAQGVRFSVCMNTVHALERAAGKPFALNPHARPVPAGVARMLALAEHGYTVVRP